MTLHSPLSLLAALGALSLSLPGAAFAAPDTSEWVCESCPFPKGASGSVDAGLGSVSDASKRFGDLTGLQRSGAHLVLGGSLLVRGEGGWFADLRASDLGLDTRELSAQAGREGLFTLRLGYAELPRYFAEGAVTPFLGSGGSVLTLPAGFAADTSATMPLAATLRPVELGYKWQRLDLAGDLVAGSRWTVRVGLRRDMRDGTRPLSAAFFSTAAQMAAPVDHVTDQFELTAAYQTQRLQASLAYQISQFSNGTDALTFANPFTTVVPGSTRGQLALPPDNQFHQLVGSAGYTISPILRASADVAFGRMTQNASYLASTLTPGVAARVPALPDSSLDGRVDTFNGSVKLSATPRPDLRLNALLARDIRSNDTGIRAYPQVATDMFYRGATRSNTPFSLTQDRLKISADWRGPGSLRLAGGADQDNRQRSYHEVVDTRETTVWARLGVQAMDELALAFKLAHGERSHSTYGVAYWFGAPENPLLRKYNLAERRRDLASARADLTLSETLSLGLSVEYANDDYRGSVVGLTLGRSVNIAADLAYAISEHTRVSVFAQGERIRSRQAGSQIGSSPDWQAQSKDRFEVLGIGLRHAAIPDKLDIGVDLGTSRSRSDIAVETGIGDAPFPTDKTTLDSLKIFASYKLSDKLTLSGSLRHEEYQSRDWRLDGVLPATVSNLLLFGNQPPAYRVTLVQVAVRYRF